MGKFTEWLKTAWTDLLSWFSTEEQKIASFLYPIFQDAKQLITKDLWADIIDGVPVVAAAMTAATPEGALAAGLAAAETFLVPVLAKQGVELEQTTINAIANGLVAQAQAGQKAVTADAGQGSN